VKKILKTIIILTILIAVVWGLSLGVRLALDYEPDLFRDLFRDIFTISPATRARLQSLIYFPPDTTDIFITRTISITAGVLSFLHLCMLSALPAVFLYQDPPVTPLKLSDFSKFFTPVLPSFIVSLFLVFIIQKYILLSQKYLQAALDAIGPVEANPVFRKKIWKYYPDIIWLDPLVLFCACITIVIIGHYLIGAVEFGSEGPWRLSDEEIQVILFFVIFDATVSLFSFGFLPNIFYLGRPFSVFPLALYPKLGFLFLLVFNSLAFFFHVKFPRGKIFLFFVILINFLVHVSIIISFLMIFFGTIGSYWGLTFFICWVSCVISLVLGHIYRWLAPKLR
jgi:hypothetical protein